MSAKVKVLVSDNLSTEGLLLLQETQGVELLYQPGLTPEKLRKEVADIDALIVRSGTQVTAELLEAAPRLRVVGRAGFGVDNIDLTAANRKGVVVLNTPLGNATTTAEHTLAMILALARRIPQACRSVRDGRWSKQDLIGIEVTGKTLGVLGAGKIGSLVVERALGLKMRVLVHDPFLPPAAVNKMGAEPVCCDDLFRRADFITLHVPYTAETENLVTASLLARMKPTAYLVNCAQGGLVDEEALVEALRADKLAGAALDGFAQEPPSADHPLLQMEQVICTPHIRAASADAQANVSVQVAQQVADYLTKGIVTNALNAPALSGDVLPELRPFLDMADRLGGFMAQYGPRGVTAVQIDYLGSVTDYDTSAITRAILRGLLAPAVGPSVNFINAPFIAKERGIAVTESRSKALEGFSNMVKLRVTGARGENSLCGTLFNESLARIVQVDDFQVEAEPQGYLLVVHNRDVPGVIGFLGQTLAAGNVNIANMNLSRRTTHGKVASLITLDSPVPKEVLAQLRAHGDIFDVTPVHLP